MAILQAIISLITRSLGKILNAIFGWAVVALFGQTSAKEQTVLSAVVAAAAAWPLLLLGIVVPKITLFVISFVPLSKSVPSIWLRIVWIALALTVPLAVGSVIAARSPDSALPEPRWKKLLRGFQVTFALALTFLLMIFIAPGVKIASAIKGRVDVRIPLLVGKGAGAEIVEALVVAIGGYGLELRAAPPPWYMSAPSLVMRKLGGRAFAASEPPRYRAGDGLEFSLNPNELLLRGKPNHTVHAQALAQEVLAPRDALETMDAHARDLEKQIKRVWKVYAEDPARHRESTVLLGRVGEIARELSRRDVPFDEWQIVYRELLQLDRALRGEKPLLAQEAVEMAKELEVKERIALPAPAAVPARLEAMSNKELLQHVMQGAVLLAKKEVELAKVELKADLKNEVAMAKGLGAAGLCAIWTVGMMLVAAAMALGTRLPEWAAALIVAAGVLLVGTVAGLLGWGKRVKNPMETTRRSIKEDVQWAKERIA